MELFPKKSILLNYIIFDIIYLTYKFYLRKYIVVYKTNLISI